MNKNYKENLKKRNVKEEKNKILNIKEFKVNAECELLDYLINVLKYNRTNAKNLLSHHLISIDGAPVSQFNFILHKGDTLIVSKTPIKKKKRKDLPIIYEDEDIIVIDKPAGLLSVANDKEKSSTAYRMVMDYLQEKDKHNRIFVVHRIDKETSGILMFAKNVELQEALQNNWNNLVKKRGYFAICEGVFDKKEDTIINYLKMNALNLMFIADKKDKKAQKCITKYKVINENKNYSLVDVDIFTGRKNQIRVTLGSLGHFIVGDDKYGNPINPINRLCLHAYALDIVHPFNNKLLRFRSKIPAEFNNLIKKGEGKVK